MKKIKIIALMAILLTATLTFSSCSFSYGYDDSSYYCDYLEIEIVNNSNASLRYSIDGGMTYYWLNSGWSVIEPLGEGFIDLNYPERFYLYYIDQMGFESRISVYLDDCIKTVYLN